MAPTNYAAWMPGMKEQLVVKEAPYPEPKEGEVLIKVGAVTVNPADVVQQDTGLFIKEWPTIIGADMAGTVVELGTGVTSIQKGDRVTGVSMAYQLGPTHAAYQHYAILKVCALAKLPPSVSFEQAAVLPLGMTTAAAGLFDKTCLNLALPPSKEGNGKVVLIWGGSSSVGACAIQLAVASGYEVITTASKHNFDFCSGIGASKVFDHRDQDVGQQILSALEGKQLAGTFTAVATGMVGDGPIKVMFDIIPKTTGSKNFTTVMPGEDKLVPEGINGGIAMCSEVFNNEIGPRLLGQVIPEGLDNGTIKCKPDPKIVGKGLEFVQAGLDAHRAGVSAAKIVITL